MNTDSQPEPRDKTITWTEYVVITGVLASALVVILYLCVFAGHLSPDPAAWGQFGDYFGGTLNPILGVLGLFGLYYTIQLQIKAIKDTQQQFLREQFENRFFQLLGLLNEPRSKISFTAIGSDIGSKLQAYDHIEAFSERFTRAYTGATTNHQLTDYLQHVHNLLRLLQRGKADGRVVDDFFQTAMARLLPTEEKVVLFYVAVHDEKFRQLAMDFPILTGLRTELVKVTRSDVAYLDKLIPPSPP